MTLRLTWADVDLTAKTINVCRQLDDDNWRAAGWLLARRHPTRWGERVSPDAPPLAVDGNDPFLEVDQLAERRRRKPDGY